jgi:hypothetical protein
MRKLLLTAAALVAVVATSTHAQTAPSCPSTATFPDLIKAVDDAVSGPGNKDRTCLRQVLTPDARLIPVSRGKDDGQWAPHVFTVDDYITRVAKRGSDAFYERQIRYSVDQYGHIAHLWSTYEIRETPDGKATMRGINSMQAVFDGSQWKVIEILWQAESPEETIPSKYLP